MIKDKVQGNNYWLYVFMSYDDISKDNVHGNKISKDNVHRNYYWLYAYHVI